MDSEEIIRFNVYAMYIPKSLKKNIFFLESTTDTKNWKFVPKEENGLEYPNLADVAQKIVSLISVKDCFKRVISCDRPIQNTGELEGILLDKSGCELVRSLSTEEMKELTRELDRAYSFSLYKN